MKKLIDDTKIKNNNNYYNNSNSEVDRKKEKEEKCFVSTYLYPNGLLCRITA